MRPRLLGFFLIIAAMATLPAFSRGSLTEQFQQTYTVNPHARISLNNINGDVEIIATDGNQVKIDAIKSADSQKKLDEAKINVDATSDSITIETKYPHRWNNNDPASIDYKISVPRDAELDGIDLVNGKLTLNGVRGDVSASCVNGTLMASGLAGEAKLSTVNGKLEATFDQVDNTNRISMSSVNGSIVLSVPNNVDASFEANTLSGRISNDFGFSEEREGFVGHDLSGTLGKGTTRIKLSNVNGSISIRRQ